MSIYSTLEVPGPTQTELSKPFWDSAAEGKLTIQQCNACNKAVFYPRPICPHCWSDSLDWREARGQGKLRSFSQIWKPGHPGWLPVAPYFIGLVQLSEGPTMLSHILSEYEFLNIGDAVEFKAEQVGSRILPFFKKKKPEGG